MPAAEAGRRRALGWPLALAALFAGALVLRLIGLKSGLPYVYNADENSHFVPHAIGMFGHSLNPNYYINPPAFTYVLHFVYALRWGTDPAAVGNAFARDPTTAFALARAASAVLGSAAVALTAVAGARLFADRRVGALAGALLAVAFLAVHYSHLALNDAPTLAPVALALVGVAGIYRTGRLREYALAGVAVGIGIATKYTAGIILASVIGAALVAPGGARARVRGLALTAALTLAGFLVFDPYALLDHHAFKEGLQQQTETAGDEGGKLGLADTNGWVYYLGTAGWGLGWLPSLAALGGGIGLLVRQRRLAAVLLPAPVLLFLYLGLESRFFARWMLPVYPLAALLAAWAGVQAATWLAGRVARVPVAWAVGVVAVLLCLQGLVYSVHNDRVLARADTRQLARDWMVAHIPAGSKIVVEPVSPDQWAQDVGKPDFAATGSGNRWNKWRTSRSCVANDGTPITSGACRVVKLEDYERTTRPELVGAYFRGHFCWVVTGSTQTGRAYADPKAVPQAIAYYAALKKASDVVYRVSPYGASDKPVPFSFDASFDYHPLAYERPGPEIVIHHLRGCTE
jgi:hypothetical protein